MTHTYSQVPVFILAGGLGTRISEESLTKPKPMLEVGEIPLLVHIMRWYYSFGFNDFVICAGYKSWEIKKYFLNYEARSHHLEIDHRESHHTPPKAFGKNLHQEKWRVRVIDTGLETMTGARVACALDEISATQSFDNFALTYGDGLSDVDLHHEFEFHQSEGRIGTLLGVRNIARFGELDIEGNQVDGFLEKPEQRQGFINGGVFFFKSDFRQYLDRTPSTVLERAPLGKLAIDGELSVYRHLGFWAAMDTLRDKNQLQTIWDSGKAPWMVSDFSGVLDSIERNGP